MNKKLSVVVSVYNEAQALGHFYKETTKILESIRWDFELLFVNDGSQDQSHQILDQLAAADQRVKVIHFSRNFGHESAMIAGIDYSTGDGIVCMDADLQHPPECIPGIIQKLGDGFQVVNMVRLKNQSAGWMKNLTSTVFYKLINALADVKFEANASDFFAIDRQAAEVLRNDYREKVRFLRGFVQDIGFTKTTIEYEAHTRIAGESKYNFKKLFTFSINTIMCFSNMPLKLGIYAGILSAIMGLLVMIYTIYNWAAIGDAPSGYATIVVLLCFMFAMIFLILGIIGGYIAVLFTELKARPIYIIGETKNI